MQDNWILLREQIASFSKPFPSTAIAFANDHRDEVAPHLVDALRQVAAQPGIAVDDPNYMLHEYAMHLLASWADKRAYAPLVTLGHLDENTLDGVLGDSVTEAYGRSLASVCDGDLQPLKDIFEDTQASYWARGAALNAMVVRVWEGDAPREEVVQYLSEQGDLHAQRLRAPDAVGDDMEVIDYIAGAACDLVAVELQSRIQSWFDDGLLDPMMMDRPWLDSCMSEPFETARQRALARNQGYMRDAETEMGWWAGFKDEPVRSDMPAWVDDNIALPALTRANYNLPPVETVVRTSPKIGRNDPCPCGSGKKYKKCCGVG